ncbi:MAG: GNAT family N-acetyltransferase [Rubrivivax sp.]|nr:GNAT family N-acetyltransferase [Rubrivivax sp.]MDP3612923.1 GNAT family N-acetyltransferase [Rubrivivax sp.]
MNPGAQGQLMGRWLLRPVQPADVPALADLYAECARVLGPAVYSAEQVAAWEGFGRNTADFSRYVMDADSWLAMDADEPGAPPAGFCGAGHGGEVHSLYVRPRHTRLGLGRLLLDHVLAQAAARGESRFAAWVTPFSRPVFARAGFRLVQTVSAPYQGVVFERYRVERP